MAGRNPHDRRQARCSKRKPERLLEIAVKGMLPKNRLGHQIFNKLKVYRGAEHPHAAQKPKSVSV